MTPQIKKAERLINRKITLLNLSDSVRTFNSRYDELRGAIDALYEVNLLLPKYVQEKLNLIKTLRDVYYVKHKEVA